ncbi:APC family permease [Nocardia sp. NPDC050718]|uniref:APC family permease n=1 Tax=Nocardia sp. NPDC050718 TaxID=3155788 RepID=UPI0033D954DF
MPEPAAAQADSADARDTERPGQRGIGRATLVSLSLASFVPAVAFATGPLIMFSAVGAMAWVSASVSMIATICIGASVIHFARRYVASGSLYSYVGYVFAPWSKKIVGASLLGAYITGVAGLIVVVGMYLGSFLHSLGVESAAKLGSLLIIGAVTIGVIAVVAVRGLDTSIWAAIVLTVVSLPLVLFIVGASAVHTGIDVAAQLDFASFEISGALRGAALGMVVLVGFESCAALATETADPRRNVPWAIIAPPVVIGGGMPIFIMLTVPGLLAAGDDLAAGVSAPAALAAQAGLPTWIGQFSDLVLAIASVGSALAFLNYGARLVVRLAEDGLLPPAFARVDIRRGTPVTAIVGVAVASLGWLVVSASLLRNIVEVYTMTAALVIDLWVLPYILIAVAAVVQTVREGQIRPWLWGASVIGAVSMTWVLISGIADAAPGAASKMIYVMIATVAVLLGVFRYSRTRSGN